MKTSAIISAWRKILKGERVLEVADRLKPLYPSIVGGDPLVRELELMVPLLLDRGTSSPVHWPLAPAWATLANMKIVVSIDGADAGDPAQDSNIETRRSLTWSNAKQSR